jgi:hypothetical protein
VSIKFVCSCGKRLKARDEMAERLSICPRCGSLVGIPPRVPRHPEGAAPAGAAPLPPARRPHLDSDRAALPVAAVAKAPPHNPTVVWLLAQRSTGRPDLSGRHLEEHWYECLLYPFRAWPLCVMLAVAMTFVSAGVVALLPHLVAEQPTDPFTLGAVRVSGVVLVLLVVGLPSSFFDCVLASAVLGEIYYIRWSGNALLTVLLVGIKWLGCFLAGPIVFAGAAAAYWMECGDAGVVDWLIVGELGIVAITYQLFALLTLTDGGRLRDLNPLAVIDLAHRLGGHALFVIIGAAALLAGHAVMLIASVALLTTAPPLGWLLLTGGWLSAVFSATFFSRLFGIWCHRTRLRRAAPSAASHSMANS